MNDELESPSCVWMNKLMNFLMNHTNFGMFVYTNHNDFFLGQMSEFMNKLLSDECVNPNCTNAL